MPAKYRAKKPVAARPVRRRTARCQKIPPRSERWHWHQATLLALRDQLLREQGALLQAERADQTDARLDAMETASTELDQSIAAALLSSRQNVLYEVEAALGRIKSGQYGICERTGQPIPARRLRSVPWTRFSEEAEADLEKKPGA